MSKLTAANLEKGDRLRDVDGHGKTNPYGPDVTDKIAVKKAWWENNWLFGPVLENGRIGSGGRSTFVLSYDEINARLEAGRYQPVDVEVNRSLDTDELPVNTNEDVYIRFGDIPENGRSYNNADECYEDGVSVYSAELSSVPQGSEAAGMFVPVGSKTLQIIMLAHRDTYLVTGEEVGIGVDGEPVLRNVEVVTELDRGDKASGWVVSEESDDD